MIGRRARVLRHQQDAVADAEVGTFDNDVFLVHQHDTAVPSEPLPPSACRAMALLPASSVAGVAVDRNHRGQNERRRAPFEVGQLDIVLGA